MERPSPSVVTAPAVHVVRVRDADRRPTAVVVVTAVFLVAAVVKPWGSAGPGGAARDELLAPAVAGTSLADGRGVPPATAHGPSGADISAAAGPSSGASAVPGADRGACGTGGEWLLLAHESIGDREVVALLAVDAVPATGPLDPNIPFTRLVSPVVTSLGFCGPLPPAPAPAPATQATPRATVWTASRGQPARIVASGWREGVATPCPPSTSSPFPAVASPAATPSSLAAAPAHGGASGWPAGRYVLQVTLGPATDPSSWLGLEIVHPAP